MPGTCLVTVRFLHLLCSLLRTDCFAKIARNDILHKNKKKTQSFLHKQESRTKLKAMFWEAVQNVGRNVISTRLGFKNRRFLTTLEPTSMVDSTFWTASRDSSSASRSTVLRGSEVKNPNPRRKHPHHLSLNNFRNDTRLTSCLGEN